MFCRLYVVHGTKMTLTHESQCKTTIVMLRQAASYMHADITSLGCQTIAPNLITGCARSLAEKVPTINSFGQRFDCVNIIVTLSFLP